MDGMSSAEAASFTLAELALLRGAFYVRFGQPLSLTDGIRLRTWRNGPQAGQPKIPPAMVSMLARGLLELRPAQLGSAAYFTETGLAALRLLAQDRRALNPTEYGHVRQRLGWIWCRSSLLVIPRTQGNPVGKHVDVPVPALPKAPSRRVSHAGKVSPRQRGKVPNNIASTRPDTGM